MHVRKVVANPINQGEQVKKKQFIFLEYQAKRQSLDAKVTEEKKQDFLRRVTRAKPLPPSHYQPQTDVPIEDRRKPTNPKPFHLNSVERHEQSQEEMRQSIARQEAMMRSSRQFNARSFKNRDSYWRPVLSGKVE